MFGRLSRIKGMKRSRIAVSAIIVATIVTASVISGLWMGGYLSPKKTEIIPPHPYPSSVWMKTLDITGYRERSYDSESDITCVTFMTTVYAGSPDINIANLRVHWMGPTKSVILTLNTSTPTVATPTDFACDEIPVKSPRSGDWNPGAHPPTFFLVENQVICITIDLTPQNGIDDTLGPQKTARVYFEGVPGLVTYEWFTTPYTFGTNRLIDLTME